MGVSAHHALAAGLLFFLSPGTICEASKVVWSRECGTVGNQMVVLEWGNAFVLTCTPNIFGFAVFATSDGNSTTPYNYPYSTILEPAVSPEFFVVTSEHNTPHPPYQTHITYKQLSSTRIVSGITFTVPHDETPTSIPISGGVLAAPISPKPGTTHLYWPFGSDSLVPITAHPIDGLWILRAIGPDRKDFLFSKGNTTLCIYDFEQNRQTVLPTAMGWMGTNNVFDINKRFAVGREFAVHAVPIVSSPGSASHEWNIQRVELRTPTPVSFNRTLHLHAVGYVPPVTIRNRYMGLSTDLTISEDDSVIYMRTLVICDLVPLGGECYATGQYQHLRVTALDSRTLEPLGSDSLRCLNYSTAYPGKAFNLADGGLGMVMFLLPEGDEVVMKLQLYTFRNGMLTAEPGVVSLDYTTGGDGPYNPMTISIPYANEVVKVEKGRVLVGIGGDGNNKGHVQLVELNY